MKNNYFRLLAGAILLAEMTSSIVMAMINIESDAKRLYDDKLKKSGYSKLIRPVGNTSDSLTVDIGLRLTSIIDVVGCAAL